MRIIALLVVAVATCPTVIHARKPKPTPCPAAPYVVRDTPLLGSAAGPGPDRVVVDAGHVAIASGCEPQAVKRTTSRRGTTLSATWASCTGVAGKVRMKARIDPACHVMTGTLVAKKARPRLKRQFSAGLDQCDVAGGDCGAATTTVRYCDFVPGMSMVATMPPEVLHPPATTTTTLPPLPSPTTVPPATTQAQEAIFTAIHDIVAQKYAYSDFRGRDWSAIGDAYAAVIQQGLADADFYVVMKRMITELGDDHSYYMTPQEVADEAAEMVAGANFVGIGVSAIPLPGTGAATVLVTFPGSPAREAGIRPHDLLLTVDGLPVYDANGNTPLRGVENTQLQLAFQRPGEAVRTITLTRRRVTGFTPIDACVVPTTRIGYVLLPTFLDPMIDDQLGDALARMTATGPVDGLVLDNRENGGGSSTVALPTLGFFTSGVQGRLVTQTASEDFAVTANDVGGSQSVPLVVLADRDSVSFGEIVTGVLQQSGRARVVGGTTRGNVELLSGHNFVDGSRLWIATYAFAPNGLPPGVWESVGIVPDVSVPTRWDLFTEATDPALAQAITAVRSGAAARVPAVAGPRIHAAPLPELRSRAARPRLG